MILIAGDVIPLAYQTNPYASKKWFVDKFSPWTDSLHCNKVLFIAGNHELHFPGKKIIYESLFSKDDKITYLCHSEYIHKSKDGKEYKIFGTVLPSYSNGSVYCGYSNKLLLNVSSSILSSLITPFISRETLSTIIIEAASPPVKI